MDFQSYASQAHKMKHDYSTGALLTKESDPKLPETPLGVALSDRPRFASTKKLRSINPQEFKSNQSKNKFKS